MLARKVGRHEAAAAERQADRREVGGNGGASQIGGGANTIGGGTVTTAGGVKYGSAAKPTGYGG